MHSMCACQLQVIDDSSTDSLLLVMEFVEGGSLEAPYDRASRRWEPVPEAKVLRLFRELLKVPVCLIAPRHELSGSQLCQLDDCVSTEQCWDPTAEPDWL